MNQKRFHNQLFSYQLIDISENDWSDKKLFVFKPGTGKATLWKGVEKLSLKHQLLLADRETSCDVGMSNQTNIVTIQSTGENLLVKNNYAAGSDTESDGEDECKIQMLQSTSKIK